MRSSSSSAAAGLASDEAYAEAMHAILSSEPCRGLVTEPTRLLAHVFIGSQSNAEDLTTMRRLGISHVLNCAGYKGPRPAANASPYDGLGIEYYEFKAEDSDRYDITRHFGEAFRFLDAAKRDGGVVLVHCALGINRSAAVCVAYMMVDRRMPLLAVTRVIKDRRRIVLANKSFQRQLVGFARARGLLGELPRDDKGKDDDDGDDDLLSGTVRRLTLHRAPDGVDWRFNGLNIDTGHRLDTSASYRTRSTGEWRSSLSRSDDIGGMNTHNSRGFKPTSSRYDYVGTAGDFSPHRRLLPHSVATRSRETDDVMPSYVSPRQYRASKSATSLVPVSSSGRHNRVPTALHNRSRSTSRFSVGFL